MINVVPSKCNKVSDITKKSSYFITILLYTLYKTHPFRELMELVFEHFMGSYRGWISMLYGFEQVTLVGKKKLAKVQTHFERSVDFLKSCNYSEKADLKELKFVGDDVLGHLRVQVAMTDKKQCPNTTQMNIFLGHKCKNESHALSF